MTEDGFLLEGGIGSSRTFALVIAVSYAKHDGSQVPRATGQACAARREDDEKNLISVLFKPVEKARRSTADIIFELLLPRVKSELSATRTSTSCVSRCVPRRWRRDEREPALPCQRRVVPHRGCPLAALLLPQVVLRHAVCSVVRYEVRICLCTVRQYVSSRVPLGTIFHENGHPPTDGIFAKRTLDEGSKALTTRCAGGIYPLRKVVRVDPHMVRVSNQSPTAGNCQTGTKISHSAETKNIKPGGV
mmetsp:Transcript_26038/g.68389  ORF Transcript_26038/g.68389 Transcript_26038/m.68389 type:complete len:247 (+) Transcript_26038:1260-2000(+)